MKEDHPLDTLSEYVDLLLLDVHLINRILPTSYIISQPVVFDRNMLGSQANYGSEKP